MAGALLLGLLRGAVAQGETVRNGFVLEPAGIPVAEILAGGPPRDGIPALDHPNTVPAAQADWADDDLVLGIATGARHVPTRSRCSTGTSS